MWLVHLIDDGDDKDDDDGNALMITRRLTIKLSKHAGNVLVEFFIAT